VSATADAPNQQTREVFAQEAAAIAARQRSQVWMAPSRDEATDGPVLLREVPALMVPSVEGETVGADAYFAVRGGRLRGLAMHKLLEEALTGETGDALASLVERAGVLIESLGQQVAVDPAQGLCAAEIAGCVARTLVRPEIAAVRPRLVPELAVYASAQLDDVEQITAGFADAVGFAADGTPDLVVDWKSDIDPGPEVVEHYRKQVQSYLAATGAAKGLIVFVTSGRVVEVAP
jgi:exodeoxyribonuclease-5